jgi:hypothetical protein
MRLTAVIIPSLLFFSFKKAAAQLPPTVNTPANDATPVVSPYNEDLTFDNFGSATATGIWYTFPSQSLIRTIGLLNTFLPIVNIAEN